MTFDELNLNTPLLNALNDLGYTQATTIQERAFSVVMSGRDVVGIAQTGTGKTFAYLLPCLRQWKFSKEKNPQILVLVPTRELVVQVLEGDNAIKRYRDVMGATNPEKADAGTIRKECALNMGENSVHGSDAPETAAIEIAQWFSGNEIVG